MLGVTALVLLSVCVPQAANGPVIGVSNLDFAESELFSRFLKRKGIESGGIWAGGQIGLYAFGLKMGQSLCDLKREFKLRYKIDFESRNAKGLVIRPFKRYTILFNAELPADEAEVKLKQVNPLLAQAVMKATKGQVQIIHVRKVIYIERPWISESGKTCRALQGLIVGTRGTEDWWARFIQDSADKQSSSAFPQK